MIGKLNGVIAEIENGYILLDVHSVFYKIFLPQIVQQNLKSGQEYECYTHFHVRENEISLYGFPDKEYLYVFNLLLGVPNIGPKSALIIIGYNKLDKLIEAVEKQDALYFSQIPGIGKKTSQKILLDLSNKFNVDYKMQKQGVTADSQMVVDALLTLGFKKHEAYKALETIPNDLPLEEKITLAIRNINPNGK